MKTAKVKPLLKKATLDNTVDKNFRPVSNLSYLSKLLEGAVVSQIDAMADQTGNLEGLQSAYKVYHSTETALIRVREDLLRSMDRGEVSCVILLDLSAAFDTIDKTILLNRLKYRFGFGGEIIAWLSSYLTNRSQSVEIGNTESDKIALTVGVPQGSLLGPNLFLKYITPIGEICRKHKIGYHGYADDTQNYLAFRITEQGSRQKCIEKLQNCILEIRDFMVVNKLKLNEDKTEFLLVGTKQQLNKLDLPMTIKVCGEDIKSVDCVRNLGFYMDSQMKNDKHINKIVSTAYLTLRNIRAVRYKLDLDTTKILVQSLVISKLDYCNALLLGTPKYQLNKLQRVLNLGCRIICGLRKFDHVSNHMKSLHWRKIEERIEYKVLMLVFKCRHNLAPQYLCDLFVSPRISSLRSNIGGDLFVEHAKTSLLLRGSFAIAGSRLWNSLPKYLKRIDELELFRTNLKTELFRKSYS